MSVRRGLEEGQKGRDQNVLEAGRPSQQGLEERHAVMENGELPRGSFSMPQATSCSSTQKAGG